MKTVDVFSMYDHRLFFLYLQRSDSMMLYLVILIAAFVDLSRGKCYRLLQLLFLLVCWFVGLFVCLFVVFWMLYLVILVVAFVRLGKYCNVQLQ